MTTEERLRVAVEALEDVRDNCDGHARSYAREALEKIGLDKRGKLWWVADNWAELALWILQVHDCGGSVIKVDPEKDRKQIHFIFEIDREVAVRKGWAESVDSEENWLEEE